MSSGTSIDWNKVIKKEAIGIGGIDIGEVQEVNDDYITIRKGLVDRKEYNISKSLVEDFDGIVLRFKVNEFDLSRFEKISEPSLSTSKNKVLDDDSLLKELSSSTHKETSTTGTTTVPLMAETLKVKKKAVEDKISITKESVSETKTVEIELMQETITIERRPVYDNSNTSSNDLSSSTTEDGPVEYTEEISIPLKREEPVISKKPYVKKEVMVKKKLVTEIKTVSEDITHEEIKYDYKSISNKSE